MPKHELLSFSYSAVLVWIILIVVLSRFTCLQVEGRSNDNIGPSSSLPSLLPPSTPTTDYQQFSHPSHSSSSSQQHHHSLELDHGTNLKSSSSSSEGEKVQEKEGPTVNPHVQHLGSQSQNNGPWGEEQDEEEEEEEGKKEEGGTSWSLPTRVIPRQPILPTLFTQQQPIILSPSLGSFRTKNSRPSSSSPPMEPQRIQPRKLDFEPDIEEEANDMQSFFQREPGHRFPGTNKIIENKVPVPAFFIKDDDNNNNEKTTSKKNRFTSSSSAVTRKPVQDTATTEQIATTMSTNILKDHSKNDWEGKRKTGPNSGPAKLLTLLGESGGEKKLSKSTNNLLTIDIGAGENFVATAAAAAVKLSPIDEEKEAEEGEIIKDVNRAPSAFSHDDDDDDEPNKEQDIMVGQKEDNGSHLNVSSPVTKTAYTDDIHFPRRRRPTLTNNDSSSRVENSLEMMTAESSNGKQKQQNMLTPPAGSENMKEISSTTTTTTSLVGIVSTATTTTTTAVDHSNDTTTTMDDNHNKGQEAEGQSSEATTTMTMEMTKNDAKDAEHHHHHEKQESLALGQFLSNFDSVTTTTRPPSSSSSSSSPFHYVVLLKKDKESRPFWANIAYHLKDFLGSIFWDFEDEDGDHPESDYELTKVHTNSSLYDDEDDEDSSEVGFRGILGPLPSLAVIGAGILIALVYVLGRTWRYTKPMELPLNYFFDNKNDDSTSTESFLLARRHSDLWPYPWLSPYHPVPDLDFDQDDLPRFKFLKRDLSIGMDGMVEGRHYHRPAAAAAAKITNNPSWWPFSLSHHPQTLDLGFDERLRERRQQRRRR